MLITKDASDKQLSIQIFTDDFGFQQNLFTHYVLKNKAEECNIVNRDHKFKVSWQQINFNRISAQKNL